MLKEIKDFPNYLVSDTGEIYSKNYNHSGEIIQLKTFKSKSTGYLYLTLCRNKDGKHYTKWVHRLVAETFLQRKDKKQVVNHKNGIKTDNRVENLEWCSQSYNVLHGFKVLGRKPNITMLGRSGAKSPTSKKVVQIKDGKAIAEFYGASEANKKTGINFRCISKCCLGQRKTAGGYQWKFVN